jgi:hypothetical protein
MANNILRGITAQFTDGAAGPEGEKTAAVEGTKCGRLLISTALKVSKYIK